MANPPRGSRDFGLLGPYFLNDRRGFLLLRRDLGVSGVDPSLGELGQQGLLGTERLCLVLV